MSNFVKITDYGDLVKDLSSGAVINNNDEAYRSALARRKNAKIIEKLQHDYEELNQRLKKLEELILQHK